MGLNELEITGLEVKIKEIIEEQYKFRIDELEEDIRELQEKLNMNEEDLPEEEDEGEIQENEDSEGDEDLPEEEELEENPAREEHDRAKELAGEKPSGTRVTKGDMEKLQNAPPKKVPETEEEIQEEEKWAEEFEET